MIYRRGWALTSDPPAFTPQVLGLWACMPIPIMEHCNIRHLETLTQKIRLVVVWLLADISVSESGLWAPWRTAFFPFLLCCLARTLSRGWTLCGGLAPLPRSPCPWHSCPFTRLSLFNSYRDMLGWLQCLLCGSRDVKMLVGVLMMAIGCWAAEIVGDVAPLS